MSKKFQSLLVAAALLVALPANAQVAKQAFKKSASSVETATVKLVEMGAQKKRTALELQTAKREGDKQTLMKQKDNRIRPQGRKNFAPRKANASEAEPVTVPYEADFSTSGDAMDEDFIIINNNEDLSDGEPCTWTWSASNGAYYIYNVDGTTPADDYLVLPIRLEGGKTYDVIVNAASWNYPEEFEVVAGTECTAAALTTEVIGKSIPENDAADFSGTFTPAADGVYYIAIHAISPADLYILSVYRFSIDVAPEAAAPEAVSNLAVAQVPHELKNVVTFTAPTTTIGGETLTDDLTISIVRNGETVKSLTGVAPGSEQSFTDEVEAEGAYRYQVVAANAAGQGRKSDIITVKVSMPQDVPYIVNFTDEEEFDRFLVIDNNGDGSTWGYSSYDMAALYRSDWDNQGDDYLVSQALRTVAGKKYDVTVRIAGNAYDPERFEVVAGTSATGEGLNISVIPSTDVTSEAYAEYTGSFTAETDGYYYVAVHAISDAQSFFLYVSGMRVELGAEPTAPAAPAVEATAGAEGALSATIQVTAPDKTIEGNALSAISKIELYRDGELIDEKSDVTPGAVITFTDGNIPASALYVYQAIAYNESGRGEKSEKTAVYIGLDQPKAPEIVEAVDHPTSVDLSWSAVDNVGMNGGYVNPDDVTYKVWDVDLSFFVIFNDLMASVKGQTSTSFDYAVDEGDQQDYKYFAVRPVNDSTVDEDNADWSAAGVLVGKPYDAVVEGFADEELHYFWESDASLAVTNYASDEDGVALALLADTPGQKAFISGKLNIKNAAQPMLVFDALNASNIPTLYVLGSADQGTWNLLETVTLSSEDYQTYQIPLTSLKNHERYAQIAFVANYTHAATAEDYGDYFFLDDIRIGDFFDNDLAVSAVVPAATLVSGKTMDIDVIVENTGLKDASNYTVKVLAGESELLNETVSETLAPFDKKYIQAAWPSSVFDEAGDVTITISVEYAADQNTENNSITGTFTIEEPTAAAPENLTAEIDDDANVCLAWSAPETKPELFTEDFENGFGEFTQIDADGDGYAWYHMYSDELKSHSGYGGLQSFSWIPNGVGAVHEDDWLVSPLAILDGTFSFWAAAQDGEWTDEHFAVYVSTTGNQSVDDFTQVSEEFVASGWPQEYTVDLSSYAGQEGYIAIRHFNSYDQFAMVVDDISFTKAPALPVKYNIYMDEELIATVEGDVTTYTVAADQMGEGGHDFAVTAVYADGRESRPAVVSLDVITGIQQLEESQPVDVYSVDGKLIRRQAKTLDDLKGVYIINGRGAIMK